MKYAKLIDESNVEFAPKNKGAIVNYNMSDKLMRADGYKPLSKAPLPEDTNRMYHLEYSETPEEVIEQVVFDETQEEADERERQEEEDRVNMLTMTALDFLKLLYSLGLTRQQVRAYLDENPEIDDELTYCQNVYCGVVKQLCPITVDGITITVSMVEQAFKNKYLV